MESHGPRTRWLSLLPALATVGLLFGAALMGTVWSSLTPGFAGSTGLDVWRAVLTDPDLRAAFSFSVWVALATTGVAAPIALSVAAALRRRGPLLQGLFALPILVPHLVVATTVVLWLGPGGIADRLLGTLPLHLVRDRAGLGIILAYLYKEIPFLVVLLLAAWGPQVRDREEAAALLGAGPWLRMRTVVWPAVRGPLLVGCLIVAAFVIGSFEVPLVVGPTHPVTLPVLALQATQTAELAGRARAAAILLIAAAVSILLALVALPKVRRGDG